MNRGQVIILRFTRNNWTGRGKGWGVADNGKGHFVIVKNRLPPSEIFSKALMDVVLYRHLCPCKKKKVSKDGIITIIISFLRYENDSNFNPFPQTIVRTTSPSKDNFTLLRGEKELTPERFSSARSARHPFGIWEKGNEEVVLGSFVVWSSLLIPCGNAACPRNVYIYSARATAFPPTPTPLFCSCFKIFGLYERGRRVHKLYDAVSCDAKNRSASRNIMSRRLFPRAENTANKAHKLLRADGGQRGREGEDLSDELPRRIEYSLNTPSSFL